jgi:hypothetical protein
MNRYLLTIVQVALLVGITVLAMYEKEGWGWLVFALLISLDK